MEDTRRDLRQVLVRVEVAQKEMTFYYVSPLVERPKTAIALVPPWEGFLIASFPMPVEFARFVLNVQNEGRGVPITPF